jgi:hypothetical protein
MANKRSRSRKSSNSRTKSRRRKQHGGDSAWEYVMKTVGDGPQQFTNSLTLQSGQNLSASKSNDIVPIGKINAQDAQPMLKPNMTGGKRRAKGGSWGAVAAQAFVPGVLLGAQQLYGRSRRNGIRRHGSRRH